MMDFNFALQNDLPIFRLTNPFDMLAYNENDDAVRPVEYATRYDIQVGDHIDKDVVVPLTYSTHTKLFLGSP